MKYLPLISIIISVIALIVAIYSLYLQRKDKKPLLRITANRDIKDIPLNRDEFGRMVYGQKEVILLEVRNLSERENTVEKVEFFCNNKILTVKPSQKLEKLASQSMGEIIVFDDLRDGYFIVSDALGHQFMSNRI